MAEDDAATGGAAPGGEDTQELQQQLEAARADIERLQTEAADAAARAEVAAGEADLAISEAATLQTALADANARIEVADERERDAADRYRTLMLRAEPALPSDMIAGDTIDAVDASVAAARDVVGRVRTHIDALAGAARVPAGAPQRAAPDISAMTPQQKIRYGLEQRAQG